MFEAYVIPCYPLNAEHRSWRKGRHYDPPEVLKSPNLVGNLALCSKRELAWATSRQKILSTPGPVVKLLNHMGDAFDEAALIAHMPNFFLQTSGSLRDARGNPIAAGRVGGKQWEKPLHELLHKVSMKKTWRRCSTMASYRSGKRSRFCRADSSMDANDWTDHFAHACPQQNHSIRHRQVGNVVSISVFGYGHRAHEGPISRGWNGTLRR
eukprot:2370369-Amphidinium_carterae.1